MSWPKTMTTDELRTAVFSALDNALENGFDETRENPDDVAHELITYDCDLEEQSAEELKPFVIEWQKKHV